MGRDQGYENNGFDPSLDLEFSEINISTPTPSGKEPPPPYHVSTSGDNNNIKKSDAAKSGDLTPTVEASSPERMVWDSQWEFLMSCISMSVGLGNVWRFPVTAFKNGGGAFLIPYLVVLIFIGRPIYFLELCLGQFTSFSQVKVWRCVPFFKGVGYGSMIATMAVLTYYVSIMSLTCYYFLMSFQANLPWATCDEAWADFGSCNGTALASGSNRSIPEMYFIKEVLREYDDIENGVGNPDWRLSGCLLFCWVVIFFSLIRGVKSSGKVAYFTAIFPYVVMLILLVRGVTLEGAWDGIYYFITPKWEKLLEPGVWYAAVTQCFFSLNTGFGSIIMFSSYNPFHHNIYRDALIVSLMDTFTSFLAGFTIFAVLGNLAFELGTDVQSVVSEGPGLAFISYPDAIAKFTWVPQLFAVLFFMMLFTLGIGSSMSDAGAIITLFCDRFPAIKRWKITLWVCLLGCTVGLVYCTPGGQFILNLVDFFGGTFVIYATSTLEVIGIAWIYGVFNFIDDIEFMLNMRIGWYWKICWGFIIPVGLTGILVYSLIEDGSVTYKDVAYPASALVCGWMIAVVALMAFPIGAVHSMYRTGESSLWKKFLASFRPKENWGPRDPKIKLEWLLHKQSIQKRTLKSEFLRITRFKSKTLNMS